MFIIGEIGGDDRSRGGEVNGDLALDRIVFAAGESWMRENIGALRQGDDFVGIFPGQDDEPIGEDSQAFFVPQARLDRSADEDAATFGTPSNTRGKASIKIGTPWLGCSMLPTYITTL